MLVPISTILIGGLTGHYIGPFMSAFMDYIGAFINMATELHPIPMGIIVSVVMGGIILTLPISSAALAISLKLSGLAAGAATAGCAANMIGFAVASYKENGFGGFIAQGIGTSMLQISNIVKKSKDMDSSNSILCYIRPNIFSSIKDGRKHDRCRNGYQWLSRAICNNRYYGYIFKGFNNDITYAFYFARNNILHSIRMDEKKRDI